MEPLTIRLNIHWKKSKSKFSKCGFSGGYDYQGYPNAATCNGGFGTPDFDMTLDNVKNLLHNRYSEYEEFKGRKIEFKVTVSQDDRNPKMDSFF